MEIRTVPLTQINPATYNPRRDLMPGDPEYKAIERSIKEFGLVDPLVWNEETGNLVGGHQRLKVIQDSGVDEVEVSVVHLDETSEAALNLALNKVQGEWDFPKLKDLLQELDTGAFDITITGFDEAEIEELMTQFFIPTDDDLPEPLPEPEVAGVDSRTGRYIIIYRSAQEREAIKQRLGITGKKVRYTVEDFDGDEDE